MKSFWLLLSFLFLVSCKSIKKDKFTSQQQLTDSVYHSSLDQRLFQSRDLSNLLRENISVTLSRSGFQAFDSAGVTVFKPETVSETISRTTEQENKDIAVSEESSQDSITASKKQQSSEILDLKKESESEGIFGGIMDAIMPSWTRIILAFLVVLIPLISAIWLKRRLKKQTDTNDGISPD